jgi:hypothetical protein
MIDDRYDWIADALDRPPVRIDDETSPESLQVELTERLKGLLASHNGLKPTAEGWRALALALALQHEPAFAIETPVDRTGRSGSGGRPAGWNAFFRRSMMRAEMRKGKTQTQAAKIVARRTGDAVGTVMNSLTQKSAQPDFLRRAPYERKAEKAMEMAAASLSQE